MMAVRVTKSSVGQWGVKAALLIINIISMARMFQSLGCFKQKEY